MTTSPSPPSPSPSPLPPASPSRSHTAALDDGQAPKSTSLQHQAIAPLHLGTPSAKTAVRGGSSMSMPMPMMFTTPSKVKIPFGLSPDTSAASVSTGPLGSGLGFAFGFNRTPIQAPVPVGIQNDTQAFDVEPPPFAQVSARPRSGSSTHNDAGEGDLMIMMDDHEDDPDDFLPADFPSTRPSLSASTPALAAARPPRSPVSGTAKPEFNPDTLLTFPSMETANSAKPDDPEPESDHHHLMDVDDNLHRASLTKDLVLTSSPPPPPVQPPGAATTISRPAPPIEQVAAPSPASDPAPMTMTKSLGVSAVVAVHSDPPTANVSATTFRKPIRSPPLQPFTTSKLAPSSSTGRSDGRSSSKDLTSVNPEMLYDTPVLDFMSDSSHPHMPTSSPIPRDSSPDKFLVLDKQPEIRLALCPGYNVLGLKPQPITGSQLVEPQYPQHMVYLPSHLTGFSRIHAVIHVRKDGRVFIHDNRSKNGTTLDPLPSDPNKFRRLAPYIVDLVNPGEHIQLASHRFTLESTCNTFAAPAPKPAARVLTRAPTGSRPASSAATFVAREPTPPGSLTPTPASVARTLSSSSASSSGGVGGAPSAIRPAVPSSPAALVADTSTAAQHGSVIKSSPFTLSGTRAIERLRTMSNDDPEIEAFLRDLPPITRLERKSSGGLASKSPGHVDVRAGVGSEPLVVSSQTQRVPGSQVNVNGYDLDQDPLDDDGDDDIGGGKGFRSPGLSPISRVSLGSRRMPGQGSSDMNEEDKADDAGEGDVDLILPRPPSASRPSSGGFASSLFSAAARSRSTASPAMPRPAPLLHDNIDESLDLMDMDHAQDSCATTVSRLRIHDGPMSSSVSPFPSSPLAPPKRTATGDSAVERTALSPPVPAGMHLPPPPQLFTVAPSSSSSTSTSSSALRRKPAQPKRHSSFSVSSPEPSDEAASDMTAATTAAPVMITAKPPKPRAARQLPTAKRSKPVMPLATTVHVDVPPVAPRAHAKRKRRGSSAAAAAADADSSSTDNGSDSNADALASALPPMKRTRTSTAITPADADANADADTDPSPSTRSRSERKAKAMARSTAGEQAAIEAQFNANLKVEMRKRARSKGRRMSSGGRSKVEEEIESEDDDQMEVDVQPQVKSTGKAKTAAKDGRKRAVELHVATDETDNEDKMDVDEAPSAAATSNSKRPAAAAAAKKATRKSKAKVTKSESAASALSTPAASRRSSSSKSAAIIDPDQDAPSFTVLFTGGSKAAHDADRALVAKLGGETTDQWQDANVLIVDKVRRTVKFLCSLASGIDIVSPAWLAASKKAKRLMPTDGHALVDREMEAKFGFSLSQSMERRGAMMEHGDRVFSGLRFFVCSGTVPALHDMKEIIAAAGGSLVHSIPGTRAKSQDAAEQGLVAIAGDGVADADQRKRLADLGYALHSAEFVLSGVLKQELDWETHRVGQVKEEDAVAASASFATGRTTRRGKRSG